MSLCDVVFCLPNQNRFNPIRWFLQEKRLREKLTEIYLAVNVYRDPHSNAKIFSNLDTSSLESNITFFGSPLQKGAAEDIFEWLKDLKDFSKSDDIFSEQILEPIKEIARYRIRASPTHSQGWIFAKSKPFRQTYAGAENVRVTLSVLFPQLETIMSMRVDVDLANKLELGSVMHDFQSILPVPHVNRIRQTVKEAQRVGATLDFSNFHYLFASLVDIEQFACSLEMRHYTEISTEQSDKSGAFLGALLIIPGRIKFVNGALVYVESILNGDCVKTFWISPTNEKLLQKNLRDYVGKTVLVAAVKWYDTGFREPDTNPEHDEIITMQEKSDESRLAHNELLGFLRVRNMASVGEIMEEFDEGSCKRMLGKYVNEPKAKTYSYQQSIQVKRHPNIVIKEFLDSTDRIRKLRHGASHQHGLLVMPEDVLDEKKMNEEWISSRPKTKVSALQQLITNLDNSEKKIFKSSEIPVNEKDRRGLLYWWKATNIATGKRKLGYKITKFGRKVAYIAARDRIVGSVNTSGPVISLVEIENNNLIPASLILMYLEEEAGKGNVKVSSHGNLFWFRPATVAADPSAKQCVSTIVQYYVNQVTDSMAKSQCDAPRERYCGDFVRRTPCSHFTANMICDLVEKNGIDVVPNPRERSWTLSLDKRIQYFLGKSPNGATFKEIKNGIMIPGGYLGESEETRLVKEELESMRQKNTVTEENSRFRLA